MDPGPPAGHALQQIFIPIPGTSTQKPLYQGLLQRPSSAASVKTLLGCWGWGHLTLFHSDTVLSTFLLLSLLLVPGSIMLQEPFVWNSQRFQTIPHICADPLALQQSCFLRGKNGRGGWHFSHLTSCLYYGSSDEGLTVSFVLASCLHQLLCISQLSTLSARLSS